MSPSDAEKPEEDVDGPPLFAFFNEIGIIEQLARNRFTRVLPKGMQVSHFSVLNHFVRLGGEKTPAELARAFQVSKGAMTNTLQRLEAAGLVVVRPNDRDGRSKRVAITAEGRAARDEAIAALGPELERLAKAVDAARLEAALPLLRDVRRRLDETR